MSEAVAGRPAARLAWRLALTLAATCALLAVLVHDAGSSALLLSALHRARPEWVGFAFLLSCACVILGVVRWQLVLAAMGRRLGFRRALEAVLATWPLAVVTPSRANELLRAVVVRDAVPLAAGTGSILAEKAVDLFVLLGLAALGAALRSLWPWVAVSTGLLFAELAVVLLILQRRRWFERLPVLRRRPADIAELLAAFGALRRAPSRLMAVGAVSLVVRLMTVGVTHALLVAVGADARLVDTVTLWPLAMLVGIAPVTLAGMGTRDAVFIYLLEARGATLAPSAVLVATMGYSVVAIWSFALIGLPFMGRAVLRARRARDAP